MLPVDAMVEPVLGAIETGRLRGRRSPTGSTTSTRASTRTSTPSSTAPSPSSAPKNPNRTGVRANWREPSLTRCRTHASSGESVSQALAASCRDGTDADDGTRRDRRSAPRRLHDSTTRATPGSPSDRSDHRVATQWAPVYDGVFRMPGAPATWRGDLRRRGAGRPATARRSRIASAAALYEVPGRSRDLVEITCLRWKRSMRPGLVVHESAGSPSATSPRSTGSRSSTPELHDARSSRRGSRTPNYLEAVIHAAAPQAAHHVRVDARDVRPARSTRAARASRATADRARALEPGERADRERDGDAAAPDAARARPARAGPAVRGAATRTGCSSPAPMPALPAVADRDRVRQSMQEHLDEFQIAADDRRRNRDHGRRLLAARRAHGDLEAGGDELADADPRGRAPTSPNWRDRGGRTVPLLTPVRELG